jgi:hypothetical protein
MTRLLGATAALVTAASAVAIAQPRDVQRHSFDDPEGRLMTFYAAALSVSAIGTAAANSPWTVTAGIELSHIPQLTRRQRTAGFDKPESSNLSPLLPRARVSLSTAGGVRIEGSWLPPVAVFDARANLYAIALSRSVPTRWPITVTPRLVASAGRARGAITCNDDLRRGTPSEQVYYAAVCHGRQSDDHFVPRQLSGELIVSAVRRTGVVPFATVGMRRYDTRFDIGVQRSDGSRDTDHPILVSRTTRPFLAAGAVWRTGFGEAGGEIHYAPGSLVTARVRFDVELPAGLLRAR